MKKITIWGGIFLVAAVLLIFFSYRRDGSGWLPPFDIRQVNGGVFILLMTVLPILGVSIGIFLVFVGMRFGMVTGVVITGILMLFHMAVARFLVHTYFRRWIADYLTARQRSIPSLNRPGGKRIAFLFALMPGLPYAMKNYLLALSDISFRDYMLINWSAQFALSIPFIVLGEAVMRENGLLLAAILCLLVIIYLILNRRRRRLDKNGYSRKM